MLSVLKNPRRRSQRVQTYCTLALWLREFLKLVVWKVQA
jgi:hypothetical protein